jgi:hypothetical protein
LLFEPPEPPRALAPPALPEPPEPPALVPEQRPQLLLQYVLNQSAEQVFQAVQSAQVGVWSGGGVSVQLLDVPELPPEETFPAFPPWATVPAPGVAPPEELPPDELPPEATMPPEGPAPPAAMPPIEPFPPLDGVAPPDDLAVPPVGFAVEPPEASTALESDDFGTQATIPAVMSIVMADTAPNRMWNS